MAYITDNYLKNNNKFKKKAPGLSQAIALVSAVAVSGQSVQAQRSLQLEETLVTATKRETGMQDVPIALSVMAGEMMLEQGVRNMEELSLFIPNFTVQQTSGDDAVFIRGLGSPGNRGFEQSVGIFIDGVYFSRATSSRSAFLDLARAEVLKGPQSTLFGKSTIGGALNITTNGPTQEFEAIVRGTMEPEFDGWSLTGILSGALTDTVRARAVFKQEETDGWMDNKALGEDEEDTEDTIARLVVDWNATEDLSFRLKLEDGESDIVGRNTKIGIATPQATAIYRQADPTFEAKINQDKWSINPSERPPQALENREWTIASLTFDWALGEHNLRSVTAYTELENTNSMDVDFGPLELLRSAGSEEVDQLTQEFILTSPSGGSLEYLVGAFYQEEDLDNSGLIDILPSAVGVGGGALDGTTYSAFQQDALTLSAFTQLTWHASDRLRVIGGLRYSYDEKELDKSWFVSEYTNDVPNTGLLAIGYAAQGFGNTHTLDSDGMFVCVGGATNCSLIPSDNKIDDEHWTGDITLQWDATDDIMTYLKVANGYKAGGFDARDSKGDVDVLEFDDETVAGVEIGAKMDIDGGRGRINVAAFYNEFDDVQVSIFTGGATFQVSNAAETESTGVEIDGMYRITEDLTVNGALAYLDASYKKFENAQCTAEQNTAFVPSAPGEICAQDLSGEPLNFSPEWSSNLTLDYRTQITAGMMFGLSGTWVYTDSYHAVNDNDPVTEIDSFSKYSARAFLASADGTWSVALLGKNLSDEDVIISPKDVPLGAFGFAGSHFMLIDAPRSYEIQAEYRF